METYDLNEKQLAILGVAETLFAEKGFEAASVREIAKEAGVNLAMINYYFGSKEKLLESLFLYKTTTFRLSLEVIAKNEKLTSREKLIVLATSYIDRVFSNSNFHKIMIKSSDTESPALFDTITKMKLKNRDVIHRIIQDGIDQKEFSPSLTAEKVMSVVFGVICYVQLNKRYYAAIWDFDESDEGQKALKKKVTEHIVFTIKAILNYNENE
ncbi:TetR/AcrR family transcriptional regulator [Marinilongibacter aquaticus]|uniref:TetR/AcrR family transcriptional regulator n=1 Tax=Marinilongibacter aquaticus TaxID=2975157 RepID=UPI0021BD98C5|nr:TetR/AcrR family transcriptional regulator [Marinilongibacter aquaticus]UBM60594.1 TetR/AcrR family transcriptional regulator [Marinilongibacter aquaticus]